MTLIFFLIIGKEYFIYLCCGNNKNSCANIITYNKKEKNEIMQFVYELISI